jgi:hypothetical protein
MLLGLSRLFFKLGGSKTPSALNLIGTEKQLVPMPRSFMRSLNEGTERVPIS